MFTGIIENQGVIKNIEQIQSNIRFWLTSEFTHELQIDQSVAHDGVCLTVVAIEGDQYAVDAIQETLSKTNLGKWEMGKKINLERSVTLDKRIDGHIVQGHADTKLVCENINNENGSWTFTFGYTEDHAALLIPKGSVSINGISLTISDLTDNTFSVSIIPYTYEHTNLSQLKVGDTVNVEFDMVGKYIHRIQSLQR